MNIIDDSDLNFIKREDYENIYDGQGFVSLWDFSKSNLLDESRIETISTVASVCYGKDKAANPKILYDKLKAEDQGIPTSTFEFIRRFDKPEIKDSFRNNRNLELTSKNNIHKQLENIVTFRVCIPMNISKQLVRHRQFSYQELSRRFVPNDEVEFEIYTPYYLDEKYKKVFNFINDTTKKAYSILINKGCKPSVARGIIPSNYMTVIWIQSSKKWINYFLKRRTDKEAQREMRDMAKSMKSLIKKNRKYLLK